MVVVVIPDEFENCSFQVYDLNRDFDGDCIVSVDCFWQDGHFYYINLVNSRAWKIFPSSEFFFNFFLQRLEVPVIEIFLLFV